MNGIKTNISRYLSLPTMQRDGTWFEAATWQSTSKRKWPVYLLPSTREQTRPTQLPGGFGIFMSSARILTSDLPIKYPADIHFYVFAPPFLFSKLSSVKYRYAFLAADFAVSLIIQSDLHRLKTLCRASFYNSGCGSVIYSFHLASRNQYHRIIPLRVNNLMNLID